MQLDGEGEAIILVGAKHILSHKVDMSYSMFNANAHPAYQYFNADKSVALVTGQSIQNNRTTDRGNDNAAPEYICRLAPCLQQRQLCRMNLE
jgi:hypothetical protein